MSDPIIHMQGIKKRFGNVIALNGVTFDVRPGECHCLLGDNGAGKSTFIKTMSGVHKPTEGTITFEGRPMQFDSPRDAMEAGIATVFQDLAMIPLMSVTRNFFMGREPTKGRFIKRFDLETANRITMEKMRQMGINLRAPDQAVGTLSGGERQTVAIARAVHFGAKVLILDEPTSALGVRQTSNVLATIARVRAQGVGVVFISHNVRHALAVGDRFTVLNRGQTLGTAEKGQIDAAELQTLRLREVQQLSGGESARTTFARVLAQDTPLLLLDEPTAALDLRHQERTLRSVRACAEAGACVIVVLHDLNLAAGYADRIVLLEQGRVAADGTPAQVLTEDNLQRVYQQDVVVLEHPRRGVPLVVVT